VIPADRVLKQGLASFNKQNFVKALESFSLLIENNPKDVNAQFYSALSWYNLNRTDKAIEYLNEVLKNSNSAFHPEAQWYLALVTLKAGNKESARQLFESIVSEKGYYSKRAAEKLKKLQG
jgi:tetratricopeptide (TPR) repeat protein